MPSGSDSVKTLLASVLRGERPDEAVQCALNTGQLEAEASRHEVLPLLACSLESVTLPVHVRERLQTVSHQHVATELAVERELRRVLDALAQHGVQTVLFKGSHLAYTHYPRPDLRPRVDSDMLIDLGQRERAHAAIIKLGYREDAKVSGELSATQKPYALFRDDTLLHQIDLHWRIASPQVFAHVLTFEELLRHSRPVAALGPAARGASDVHALIIACMHRVAHHHDEEERLKWLYDIHLIANGLDTESWDTFASVVTQRGVAAVCLDGLERTASWFHTPVPPAVRDTLRMPAVTQAERTAAYLTPRPRARAVLDDLRSLSTWRDRATLLGEHLFPSPDYMRGVYAPEQRAPLPALYVLRILRGARSWLLGQSQRSDEARQNGGRR